MAVCCRDTSDVFIIPLLVQECDSAVSANFYWSFPVLKGKMVSD